MSDIYNLPELPKLGTIIEFPRTNSDSVVTDVPEAGTYQTQESRSSSILIEVARRLLPTFSAEVHVNANEASKLAYLIRLQRMLWQMEEKGFTKIDHESLSWFAASIAKLSYEECAAKRHEVRRLAKWLLMTGRIPAPIGLAVAWPKGIRHERPTPISLEEYTRLRAYAKGDPVEWLFILGWHTGMALVDCVTLRWGDVDMQDSLIRKRRTKSKTPFIVPFHEEDDLGVLLRKQREKHPGAGPDDPVFHEFCECIHGNGSRVWESGLVNYRSVPAIKLKRYFKLAKIPKKKRFHSFRRAFISGIANSQMSTALGVKMTGHLDPKVYASYVTPDVDSLRDGLTQAVKSRIERAGGLPMPPSKVPKLVIGSPVSDYKAYTNAIYYIHAGQSLRVPGNIMTRFCKTSDQVEPGPTQNVYPCTESGELLSNKPVRLNLLLARRIPHAKP